jgi:hypothetical protein
MNTHVKQHDLISMQGRSQTKYLIRKTVEQYPQHFTILIISNIWKLFANYNHQNA